MKIFRVFAVMLLAASFIFASACETNADVVSRNISVEAGMFKINRRIVFYNGITDSYILTVEGRCSVDHADKLAVTCKTGEDSYKKHYLGLSDNVTYFSEQLDNSDVSAYRYKVIFKPQVITPDVDLSIGAIAMPNSSKADRQPYAF